MGQKVHPIGMRLGIVRQHDSLWYAEGRDYTEKLLMDIRLREHLMEKLKGASVSRIVIERPSQSLVVTVHTARPGLVIGKKGGDIEELRKELEVMSGIAQVNLNVVSIDKPDLEAKLVAENIAQQLERRIMFRRAMKRAVTHTMRAGAEGVRIQVSGRLGGAEIARTEWYREGRVPLHTLRADIDFNISEAHTTYGVIGVKVWIFRGETLDKPVPEIPTAPAESAQE